MEVLLYTILSLCALGVLAAVVLYFVAQKFRVEEDPRIDEVEKMLPGANCGGCGFAGCRGMADALVKRDDISELFCPVGGGDCMKAVAAYLGKAAAEKQPEVATVRCGGTCEKRPRTNQYDGARSCAVASSLYVAKAPAHSAAWASATASWPVPSMPSTSIPPRDSRRSIPTSVRLAAPA